MGASSRLFLTTLWFVSPKYASIIHSHLPERADQYMSPNALFMAYFTVEGLWSDCGVS